MNDADYNLKRYLEMEGLLNAFFAAFNYCLEQCVQTELHKNNNQPVALCCKDKFYCIYDLDHPAFEKLRHERERLYGRPTDYTWTNPVSPCEYHDPTRGCVLFSHKSPICLSFLCRKAIDYLRTEHNIYFYDYLGINYALEWILTGDLPEKDWLDLKNNLIEVIPKTEKRPLFRKGVG
jgi:hypothetical protein